jgi:hypothetical protein
MTATESGSGAEFPETLGRIECVAVALRSHNIDAVVAQTADEAREAGLDLIRDGATAASPSSPSAA